jgi:hypothetical protein
VGVRFPQSYYKELTALYTRKRDVFLKGLDRLGLKHNVPQGTYFVLLDISDFLALDRFRGWSDLEFCEWMIREIGVAAVPGSSFFREPVNHLIRLHFARSEETLEQALDRLAERTAASSSRAILTSAACFPSKAWTGCSSYWLDLVKGVMEYSAGTRREKGRLSGVRTSKKVVSSTVSPEVSSTVARV